MKAKTAERLKRWIARARQLRRDNLALMNEVSLQNVEILSVRAERDREKAIRAFLYSVGVTRQTDHQLGDFLEYRFRVHSDVLKQVRDRDGFIRQTVEGFVENTMRKWEGRGK